MSMDFEFVMSKKKLIQRIAKLSDFSEIIYEYQKYINYLYDVSIIKSTNNEHSIDLYSQFSEIPDIKKQLYTPFKFGKVNHICFESLNNYHKYGVFYSREQRCISFDTQTVSYIDKYYRGMEQSLSENIQNVIDLLHLENVSIDYIPYAMENLLFSNQNKDVVLNTLFSFEKIISKHKQSDDLCIEVAEETVNLYEKFHHTLFNGLDKLYYSIYSIILNAVIIQFNNSKISLDKKMEKMCDFINSKLCCLMIPEIIVSKRYFEKGQNYSFFGKVQKNRNDIIKVIRNMTWDLMHLRMLEQGCAYPNLPDICLFIPYLFTYDTRLLDVKDCYEFDALAVWKTTRATIPVYANTNEIESYLNKLCTPSATYERNQKHSQVNISNLISSLECQLLSICNTK